MRVIGLMSGTSLDGIDAVLVRVVDDGDRPRVTVEAFATTPLPSGLREAVLAAIAPAPPASGPSAEVVCGLNARLGHAFAEAAIALAEQSGVPLAQVDLVGSHGQTLWHAPAAGCTLQLGDPAVIAVRTGVTTVGDFRPADVALGGQGAPLVPFVDRLLFWRPGEALALQNVGGMANVTFVGPEGQLVAFDTGPGVAVVDRLVQRAFGRPWDEGGRIARDGRVVPELLAELMRHPFLALPAPKSTGREAFGAAFADELAARSAHLAPEDLVATATAFTADAIVDAYRRHLPTLPARVVLTGGGAHNEALRDRLTAALPGVPLVGSEAWGVPGDAKEAVAFAVLAWCAALGRPNSLPAATGAKEPWVLGKVCPGRNFRGVQLAAPPATAPAGTPGATPVTEAELAATADLDLLPVAEAVARMNAEDRKVVAAVGEAGPAIARAVEAIARALEAGGRLFYVGAGTSGRLGVLDAAECPPTFLTDPQLVQGLIAGGEPALTRAVEGAEDDAEAGARDLGDRHPTANDVVIGISASGGAPYVRGALAAARAAGATTGLVTCNPLPPDLAVDLPLVVVVGPEVLTGSTRLKAGTATKLVLNALSTLTMVQLGKTYGHLMVDVHASNAKLRLRATRLVARLTGLDEAAAAETLARAGQRVKVAVVMARLGLDLPAAEARLAEARGRLRALIG